MPAVIKIVPRNNDLRNIFAISLSSLFVYSQDINSFNNNHFTLFFENTSKNNKKKRNFLRETKDFDYFAEYRSRINF